MRVSMSTSYLYDWDPYPMVVCFAERGWRTLELHDTHAYRLLRMGQPDAVGERFRKFAADHGISFPQCHFYVATRDDSGRLRAYRDLAPADSEALAQVLEDIPRWLDFLNALGVEAGVIHMGGSGLRQLGWSEESIFARRVEVLSAIAAFAEGGVTRVCLENLEQLYGESTVEGILRLISAVGGDRLGICLDTGHAHLEGASVPGFILKAGDKLKALHVNDHAGQSDDHLLPYGKGTIAWEEVTLALRSVRYEGLFNFEIPGEARCPKPVRVTKLEYALKLAKLMVGNTG